MKRLLGYAVVALAVAGILVFSGSPAPANASDLVIPIDYVVNASTTLAKLHQTVVVPPGSFVGSIDLTTGALTGNLSLPPATTTVSEGGLGLATATFSLEPSKPVTGTVNLTNLVVTATATFNVAVKSVEPLGLFNIVGDQCETAQAISVTFSGAISLGGSSSFSGTYTIPQLVHCGLVSPVLNLVIPGPGNVFNASFSPADSTAS